ncbi:MAG: hypothetical protein RBU45_26675 [Myxococcota bacterium]|nr:hypothetical protein [Myxococcota bacterium]
MTRTRRKPHAQGDRRRRYDEIPWHALRPCYRLGETPDHVIARSLHATVAQVARYRAERGIPDPPIPGAGKWPSNNELRRQNEEAGIRGLEAAARRATLGETNGWMTGTVDRGDDD